MITKALIIPAAGSGSRMQKEIPKPYLQLSGRTILEHTIRRFLPLVGLQQIIIATSEAYLSTAKEILSGVVSDEIATECLVGGQERQDSIYKALQGITDVDLVMVHDAVRPFVEIDHIKKCCEAASEVGGAVLGVPAKDTIKRINGSQFIVDTPSRKTLWQTQTPQVFGRELIIRAYEEAREDAFTGTDDASLVERLGEKVKMVKGSRNNFKITYPLDLELAELLIAKQSK